MKKEDDSADEDIDIEKVLAETKPNLEIAEAGEENHNKKSKKKPSKKKTETKKEVKEETVSEKTDDAKSDSEGE